MIDKIIVRHFKKFETLEFRLPDHLVIAGPNNCGKTSLMQAIATWSAMASQWRDKHPDLAREEDGNYPSLALTYQEFQTVPLAHFNQLWEGQEVEEPISIRLHSRQWNIGFEMLYVEQKLTHIRPMRDVEESELEKYLRNPLNPIYIPPFSGLKDKESPYYDELVIPPKLARAKGGRILRNLLWRVSKDDRKWEILQKEIGSFFGYELGIPSAGEHISVGYRHSNKGKYYDLNNAASGFLQTLLVFAALLNKPSQVILVDEPDAHLHVLLQGKMYESLRRLARENKSQLIVATHSERLINMVEPKHLCALLNEPIILADKSQRDVLEQSMSVLEQVDLVLALSEPGILYVEGYTDIAILLAWAEVLDHPLREFLDKPFWKAAVHEPHNPGKGISGIKARDHFAALRLIKNDIPGLELCDGDGLDRDEFDSLGENDLRRLHWRYYEIESYLVHPDALIRYVEMKTDDPEALKRAKDYMEKEFPKRWFENPLAPSGMLRERKAKKIIGKILSEAGIPDEDHFLIAEQMKPEEIHPDVADKLNAIATHFGLPSASTTSQVTSS